MAKSTKKSGFGAFLQAARRKRGLTQQTLSEKAGVSISTISGQEGKEKAHIGSENMEAIANVLHAADPLTTDELRTFKHSGKLPSQYKPKERKATPKPASTASVAGALANYLHQQIMQEAGAEEYLQRLLQVAEDFSIQVPGSMGLPD